MSIQNKLKAYSYSFAYFLIREIGIKKISKVILYGSVAKSEADKDSDVDIFIETEKKTKKFEKKVKEAIEKFYKSKEALRFKSMRIENKISVKIGRLKKWPELHKSIASTGIMLWGKYETEQKPTGTKHQIIFYWDKIGKNRGSFLNKVYGYKSNGKYYEGVLDKHSGKKLGKSCVMVPIEHKDKILELIKYHKVEAKNLEVFTV